MDCCGATQHQLGWQGAVLTVSTAVQGNALLSLHKMPARRTRSNGLRHRGQAMRHVFRHHNCLGKHSLAESTHSLCGGKYTSVIPGAACTLPVDPNVLCETTNDCRVQGRVVQTQKCSAFSLRSVSFCCVKHTQFLVKCFPIVQLWFTLWSSSRPTRVRVRCGACNVFRPRDIARTALNATRALAVLATVNAASYLMYAV